MVMMLNLRVAHADCSSPAVAMTTQLPRLMRLIATDNGAVVVSRATFEICVFWRDDIEIGTSRRCVYISQCHNNDC